MEILVYDLESYENDIYDIVSKHLDIKFIKVFNKDDFFFNYDEKNESIIIIDVTDDCGEEIFNLITDSNPKQRILVISRSLSYNHTFTCQQCDNTFNRKLLLKPLNVGQLVAYIKNFDNLTCKYSSNSNNIIEIMEDVLKQFLHYSYNKEKKMIVKKDTTSKNIKELLKITELLKTHNIRFNIEGENIKLYF
ncbi:hypothetical protein [Arcobacter sp. LA11]|uniref:hypothetical protein n=1 Tax=Arcobacter sp. LA11 TaxID=1898176 RepID=UPI000932A62F|nr:hypothetical protein [Arcobacter sp. LA11]